MFMIYLYILCQFMHIKNRANYHILDDIYIYIYMFTISVYTFYVDIQYAIKQRQVLRKEIGILSNWFWRTDKSICRGHLAPKNIEIHMYANWNIYIPYVVIICLVFEERVMRKGIQSLSDERYIACQHFTKKL